MIQRAPRFVRGIQYASLGTRGWLTKSFRRQAEFHRLQRYKRMPVSILTSPIFRGVINIRNPPMGIPPNERNVGGGRSTGEVAKAAILMRRGAVSENRASWNWSTCASSRQKSSIKRNHGLKKIGFHSNCPIWADRARYALFSLLQTSEDIASV